MSLLPARQRTTNVRRARVGTCVCVCLPGSICVRSHASPAPVVCGAATLVQERTLGRWISLGGRCCPPRRTFSSFPPLPPSVRPVCAFGEGLVAFVHARHPSFRSRSRVAKEKRPVLTRQGVQGCVLLGLRSAVIPRASPRVCTLRICEKSPTVAAVGGVRYAATGWGEVEHS